MDWKRIGRLLVCLVLVVCLLVNISPIRARAVVPAWILIDLPNVVTSILIGLGLMASTAEQLVAHKELVSDACEWLKKNTSHVQIDPLTNEEKIWVYSTSDPDLPYMVKQEVVEDLRGMLFDTSVLQTLSPSSSFDIYIPSSGSTYSYVSSGVFAPCIVYTPYPSGSGRYYLCVASLEKKGLYVNDKAVTLNDSESNSGTVYFYVCYSAGDLSGLPSYPFLGTSSLPSSTPNFVGLSFPDSVFTSSGLDLGYVPFFSESFVTGYPDWAAGATTVSGADTGTDDDVPVVPVGIGKTQEETNNNTQSGVWAGSSTYEHAGSSTGSGTDSETGSGTGTGTGSGSTSVTVDMSGVITGLEDQTAQLGVWLGEVVAGIQSIPQAIKQVLVDVFVPAEDYISVKVDALRAKFPFIDSVIATGEFIRDSISGDSGPPVIYVDLGLATSGNYGSQKVLLTDFAWYAKYKPTVDTLLSAALWAFFGWRVFLKLPGIISGESGYIGEVAAHKEKMDKIRSGPPGKR